MAAATRTATPPGMRSEAKKSPVPTYYRPRRQARSGAEAGGADWQTIMYEGMPGGVALLIECLTDNRTRAATEVRTALTRQRRQPRRPRLGGLHLQSQGAS